MASRRRRRWGGIQLQDKDKTNIDPDNMDEDMVRYCMQSKGFILNPIIDWTTDEVWEFIHRYNIPYCELYDKGWKRLGCIGCPMATPKEKARQFRIYPKFKQAYIRAFDRMIKAQIEGGCSKKTDRRTLEVVDTALIGNEIQSPQERNYTTTGYSIVSDTGTEVFKWWTAERSKE